MEKHRIRFFNIYNINKKDFIINVCNIKKYIIFKRMFASKKLLNINQNKFYKFIIFTIYIYINNIIFSSTLIYINKLYNL